MVERDGIVLIAGGEYFVTPPLYRKLSSIGKQSRVIDFATSLSIQGERREIYSKLIGTDVDVSFVDPTELAGVTEPFEGASALINLADIFSDLDYDKFPLEGLKRNVTTTLELLEASRRAKLKRIIHISSGVVYGSRKQQPLSESLQLEAHDLQSAFKIASEKVVESYQRRERMETCILRLFNVYGPGQSSEAVVPYLINGALAGEPIPMGNTNHTRDFLYIDDVIDGMISALESDDAPGKVFNLASGNETSIKSLISLVEELTGQEVEINFDPDRIRLDRLDFPRWVADTSQAENILAFKPKWELRKGLSHTLASIIETAGRKE